MKLPLDIAPVMHYLAIVKSTAQGPNERLSIMKRMYLAVAALAVLMSSAVAQEAPSDPGYYGYNGPAGISDGSDVEGEPGVSDDTPGDPGYYGYEGPAGISDGSDVEGEPGVSGGSDE